MRFGEIGRDEIGNFHTRVNPESSSDRDKDIKYLEGCATSISLAKDQATLLKYLENIIENIRLNHTDIINLADSLEHAKYQLAAVTNPYTREMGNSVNRRGGNPADNKDILDGSKLVLLRIINEAKNRLMSTEEKLSA